MVISMRKIIILLIGSLALFLVYNGTNSKTENVINLDNNYEMKGVFVSYIDINRYIKSNDINTSKNNIKKMINNISEMGLNTIILQVRSFSDAIYYSDIYPWSSVISDKEGIDPGYDVLEFYIEEAKKKKIDVYAWINPYRVRTNEDISGICEDNPAYQYIGTDKLYISDGIFYNPSKKETLNLILTGVEEIIKKYSVKGILFDDYFYPSSDCDLLDYEEYLKSNTYMDIDSYHFMIINEMIKKVHDLCKSYNVIFGVSPDGNMENNYNSNFADIKAWINNRYIDFIMPQLYYGFYNDNKPYLSTFESWHDLVLDNIDFYVALAFYKVGLFDKYAGNGSNEWIDNDDVIMREIIVGRGYAKYKGFALFRYGYLFDSQLYTSVTEGEKENIKKIVN